MMRPLDGVIVLDFTTLLPGPLATLILAEAGAEVIKIERPGMGDEMRIYAPKFGTDSVNFALLNRGKKSLAIDLKAQDAADRLVPLIERADILVEQFRPGVMDRLGLGWDDVRAINPRMIYASITGYGQDGPRAQVAGHDLNYIGDVGLLALGAGADGAPVIPPALIADIAAGSYPTVVNVLLALRRRDRTGEGARLDIAMCDNLFPLMYWAIGNAQAGGQWPRPGGELVTGGSPRYQVYRTRDGLYLAAAPLEQRFWDRFCDLIGLESEYRDDARDAPATIARVAEIIAGRDAAAWAERFAGEDCCCTIVADLRAALEDPHFRARGLFDHKLANDKGETISALPVPVDGQFRAPPGEALGAPALGEHDPPR